MISDTTIPVGGRCRAAWAVTKEFVRSGLTGGGGWMALQFRVAFAATAELSGRDAVMQELLAAGPAGRAVVRIGPGGWPLVGSRRCGATDAEHRVPTKAPPSVCTGAVAWMEVRPGAVRWGAGESPAAVDVEITFRDEATAAAALRGQLDQLAALGRGDIVVRGLVPLAEKLGLVMDRLDLYFRPGGCRR